jgi:hypothetical protein
LLAIEECPHFPYPRIICDPGRDPAFPAESPFAGCDALPVNGKALT